MQSARLVRLHGNHADHERQRSSQVRSVGHRLATVNSEDCRFDSAFPGAGEVCHFGIPAMLGSLSGTTVIRLGRSCRLLSGSAAFWIVCTRPPTRFICPQVPQ